MSKANYDDIVELSFDRASFNALVHMVERAHPRTALEMTVQDLLMCEADDEFDDSKDEEGEEEDE